MEGYLFFCVSCVSRFAKNRKQQAGSAKKKSAGQNKVAGRKTIGFFQQKNRSLSCLPVKQSKMVVFLLCRKKASACSTFSPPPLTNNSNNNRAEEGMEKNEKSFN